MNKARAFDYLYYSITDHTEETLFENVFQLNPANRVVFNLNQLPNFVQGKSIETETYFRFKPTESAENFEIAKQLFKEKFEDSVKLHLRSDVQVGSALSGGLDSSAIVCEIKKILKEEGKPELQKTFSAISDIPKYSEENWMQEVIDFTGVSAYFVLPKKEDVIALTPNILWHMDEPYQSQSAFLGYHVFELAAKNGVKVLLNGQGADEYLSGYDEFRVLRWYRLFEGLKWVTLFKEFKFYLGADVKSYFTYFFRFLTYWFPDSCYEFFAKHSNQFKTYSKIMPQEAFIKKFKHPFTDYNRKRKTHIGLSQHQIYCSHLPRFLHWEDRNSMAHSIEARVPFLNKPMVNFAMGQPLDYLDGLNSTKKLMVEALKDLLPPAIYNRKDKKGFITAEEHWVREDKAGVFEKMFLNSLENLEGYINKEQAISYYSKLKTGKIKFDYLYWRIILLGMWMELFKIEKR
jgi:asparagine synthase (glutamine-hydrolysing)